MSCNHVCPNMELNGDRSSTTENCTCKAIGPAWTGNMMSPRDVVEASLKPDNIRPGFSRVDGKNPICLITNTCKKSIELPGSTKIRLTSKSLIPNFRMRASRCGCNIRLESSEGKVITPSIGHTLLPTSPSQMELIRSRMEATRNNICLFHLELYSLSMGSPWM